MSDLCDLPHISGSADSCVLTACVPLPPLGVMHSLSQVPQAVAIHSLGGESVLPQQAEPLPCGDHA